MRFSLIYAAAFVLGVPTVLGGCGASSPPNPSGVAGGEPLSAPEALDISRTHYLPGERMEFEMSLHGIVGGRAQLAVGEPGDVDGREIIIVRSQLESAGAVSVFKVIRDDVVSWIDVESGLPVYLKADVKFGEKEAQIETRFSDGKTGSFTVEYQRSGRRTRTQFQLMPTNRAAFDGHSILGALRSWDEPEGTHAFFYVLSGRRLWHNTIRFTRREKITTTLGRTAAIRIDGVAKRLRSNLDEETRKKPRHYTLWLSDDAERRPLLVSGKTEYGDVRVELVSYSRPEPLVGRAAPTKTTPAGSRRRR